METGFLFPFSLLIEMIGFAKLLHETVWTSTNIIDPLYIFCFVCLERGNIINYYLFYFCSSFFSVHWHGANSCEFKMTICISRL
eukprot:m.117382 g.117382  ORF g.117382 m.117382 type:complete len:84 (-) comp12874_c0_seq6:2206-2457(-)